jgi:mono/diheme cytochrome c family protein
MLRRILKWAGRVVLGLLVLVGLAVLFASLKRADASEPLKEKVEPTPARLARGDYLFHHVAGCANCHSGHMTDQVGWPLDPTADGAGFCMPAQLGGGCSPNITPGKGGISEWTDGELLVALREGVARDGSVLFGMPSTEQFRTLSDEDARAVVAYVRSLRPVQHEVEREGAPFPLNLILKFQTEPLKSPVPPVTPGESAVYGRYLIAVAGCAQCHAGPKGEPFAGGQEFMGPSGLERAANLTPDPTTGIGAISKAQFIAIFRANAELIRHGGAKVDHVVMPWSSFGGMTDSDLGAIYLALREVPAVNHPVVASAPSP